MPQQVKVEDLEVFSQFRAALLKFAQSAEQAISGADSQISRTHAWLESEQANYWQGQMRKRMEAATRAREALRKKKLYKDSSGRTPGAVEEEKELTRCLAAVQEAEGKIDAVRKWLPRLEKAADLYRGGVSRLNTTIAVEVPRAVALLDRLAGALEEYVQVASPESGGEAAGMEAQAAGETMARGGDHAEKGGEAVPGPPAVAGAEQAAGAQDDTRAAKREGGDVADGQ
jgi:hypothetical protein